MVRVGRVKDRRNAWCCCFALSLIVGFLVYFSIRDVQRVVVHPVQPPHRPQGGSHVAWLPVMTVTRAPTQEHQRSVPVELLNKLRYTLGSGSVLLHEIGSFGDPPPLYLGNTTPASSEGTPHMFTRHVENKWPINIVYPSLQPRCERLERLSSTKPSFQLCLTPVDDIVSGYFERDGYWRDCLSLPFLAHWAFNASHQLTDDNMPTVVEVGGNIGTCAALLASQSVHVTTLEASVSLARLIGATRDVNGFGNRLTVANVAASNVSGAKGRVFSQRGNLGDSAVFTEEKAKVHRVRHFANEIDLVRLDDLVASHVHLLKLDCQGCELKALRGATQLLERHGVDVIVFEFDGKMLIEAGEKPLDLLRLFFEHGYGVYVQREGRHLSWEEAMVVAVQATVAERDLVAFSPRVLPLLLQQNAGRDPGAIDPSVPRVPPGTVSFTGVESHERSSQRLAAGAFPALGSALEHHFSPELQEPERQWTRLFPHLSIGSLGSSKDTQPPLPVDSIRPLGNDSRTISSHPFRFVSEREKRRQQQRVIDSYRDLESAHLSRLSVLERREGG